MILLRSRGYPRNTRPCSRQCPHCGSRILQRWGRVSKPVHDLQMDQAHGYRYHCTECSKTFREYYGGFDRAGRSYRLRQLAVLVWAMGLSLDEVVILFETIGIHLSRSSIWRDSKKTNLQRQRRSAARVISVLGINQSVKKCVLQKEDLVVVVELARRNWVTLGIADEHGPQAAGEWFLALARDIGLELSNHEYDSWT